MDERTTISWKLGRMDGEGRQESRSPLCMGVGVFVSEACRAGEDAEGDALRSDGHDLGRAPTGVVSGGQRSLCFQTSCYPERKGKWPEQRILPAFSQQQDHRKWPKAQSPSLAPTNCLGRGSRPVLEEIIRWFWYRWSVNGPWKSKCWIVLKNFVNSRNYKICVYTHLSWKRDHA